eukprot:3031134-Prymnesium_polylepis.1
MRTTSRRCWRWRHGTAPARWSQAVCRARPAARARRRSAASPRRPMPPPGAPPGAPCTPHTPRTPDKSSSRRRLRQHT